MRKTFDVVRRQTPLIPALKCKRLLGLDARCGHAAWEPSWLPTAMECWPASLPADTVPLVLGRKQIEIAKETRRKLLHARLPPIAPGTDGEERMSQCSYIIRNAGMERLHSRCIG
jgi:hypothetical protein